MTIRKAVDINGTPRGWHCHSGLHLWITRENAELCCDGIHERVLKIVSLNPYYAEYEWIEKGSS